MDCREYNNASAHSTFKIDNQCTIFRYSEPYYTISFLSGTYIIELYGASGGYTKFVKVNEPGRGGYTKGVLKLRSPKTMYLYVGGQGGNTSAEGSHPNGGTPGYNGGAPGANDNSVNLDCPSAGGGGATDLRLESGEWNLINGLKSRIMVAAGGGSAGCFDYGGKGGDGGGINGQDGSPNSPADITYVVDGGKGGGQGYGNFGEGISGESGEDPIRGEAGGSGGGGYYGGEGGRTSGNSQSSSGGGGGSSFISGMDGCIAYESIDQDVSVHSSGIRFRFPNTSSGVNLGNGYAIIKKIGCETCMNKYMYDLIYDSKIKNWLFM